MHILTIHVDDIHQLDAIWQTLSQSFGGRLIHTINLTPEKDGGRVVSIAGSLDCCEEIETDLKIAGFWNVEIN